MKEKIGQLKARYQGYSPRERNLFKLCGAALCCAIIWYGVMTPLDSMIKNSESTRFKHNQILNLRPAGKSKKDLQTKRMKYS